MRITTVVENQALDGRDDLSAEFGLSMLIGTGSTTTLFDNGAPGGSPTTPRDSASIWRRSTSRCCRTTTSTTMASWRGSSR